MTHHISLTFTIKCWKGKKGTLWHLLAASEWWHIKCPYQVRNINHVGIQTKIILHAPTLMVAASCKSQGFLFYFVTRYHRIYVTSWITLGFHTCNKPIDFVCIVIMIQTTVKCELVTWKQSILIWYYNSKLWLCGRWPLKMRTLSSRCRELEPILLWCLTCFSSE